MCWILGFNNGKTYTVALTYFDIFGLREHNKERAFKVRTSRN
jgi:hypothetical protein